MMPNIFKLFISLLIPFLILIHIKIVLYLFEHFNFYLVVAIGALIYLFIINLYTMLIGEKYK